MLMLMHCVHVLTITVNELYYKYKVYYKYNKCSWLHIIFKY